MDLASFQRAAQSWHWYSIGEIGPEHWEYRDQDRAKLDLLGFSCLLAILLLGCFLANSHLSLGVRWGLSLSTSRKSNVKMQNYKVVHCVFCNLFIFIYDYICLLKLLSGFKFTCLFEPSLPPSRTLHSKVSWSFDITSKLINPLSTDILDPFLTLLMRSL